MRMFLKSCLSKTLGVGNAFPTRVTDRSELQSLMRKLHPVSCDKELIRLGPNGDGGYLVPNDLEGIEACFSPGVGRVSGFEEDCAKLGMKVYLADRSVEQPPDRHELFRFARKYVGATTSDEFMTLDRWVGSSELDPNSDLLLQIDIEGFEYEVFLSMSDALMRRFRIIVAEFHRVDQLWSKPFFLVAARVFPKILQTHTCVHIHPNNDFGALRKDGLSIPQVMEFTFWRNDRGASRSHQTVFPNPLDCNNSAKPTLVLPTCWYGGK